MKTGSTGRRKRRQFSAEYKAEAVVRAWGRQATIDATGGGGHGPLTSEERAELTRLRREMKTVTMERDFLRKPSSPRVVEDLRARRGGERELPEGADVPGARAVLVWASRFPKGVSKQSRDGRSPAK